MKYFLKLNVVSILYAFIFFVPMELMLNVYRINRLTNLDIDTISTVIWILVAVEMIGGTIALYFLTKKWLNGRKANYWSLVLWFLYLVLFTYVVASLFPMTNGGDVPNPVTGLFLIGGLIVYPFYIFIINSAGLAGED
ncbi:hypothetical protein MUN88_21565 [Gracilibacillus caseinilyticus]|uniref:Uncharacterized protein n=1 Tax=Gracilibacillus caseinilyticus TaxID=2932256 RepID=A0ABY4F2D0_9BACI|nr:hypothetical protein [Gracilibacillus caseinilyticus]UOQ48581.1 hypothetical protein MUN88_21565 [Gracilibacillus caseinilyticus]